MRNAVDLPWSTPTIVSSVSTANYEKWLAVCNGNYFMVSRANGANGQDLYQGQLGVDGGTLVTELSSTTSEISTFLSNDCKTAYFASSRNGKTQMFTSTRQSIGGTWTTPTVVTDFGDASDNEDAWMSADQRTFAFATIRGASTTKDLYISTR
jgi:hypothetical protein